MNLQDQIAAYLEVKGFSPKTISSHRSILTDFNAWQMHFPAMRMAEKVCGYDQFLRENCFRKPKTIEKQMGVVRRFCAWLDETGRVEAFKLDEQLLGRPEMRRVPDPPVGPDDVMRMLHVAAAYGDDVALRDASMMLLAVTCGLTATEISALDVDAFSNYSTSGDLYYCGRYVELPRPASILLKWYTKGRRSEYGCDPLFTAAGDGSERLTPDQVRERVSALLSIVGAKYEDVVTGDCQFRIAQYFKGLEEGERRAAALYVQAMAYRSGKMPRGFVTTLRDEFPDREKRSPMLVSKGLSVTIARDVR